MNGQLSEHPLAELIREISLKKLSGRLRLQHDPVALVVYFENGVLLYAAANVRTLRFADYLLKRKLISEVQLQQLGERKSDLQLASEIIRDNLVDGTTIRRLQLQQQADTLRLALLWTEGTWEFDHRSHLNENVNFNLPLEDLFLEAGRRMPLQFAVSRFRNEHELLELNRTSADATKLEPREGFILSRLDRPTPLNELLMLSGLPQDNALRVIYSLALAGYVIRQHWKSAFRDIAPALATPIVEPAGHDASQPASEGQEITLADFLSRVEGAATHYEVLAVTDDSLSADIKRAYYDIARQYHPDRFRREQDTTLHGRIEAVFARVTQAYETLADSSQRASYDSKLAARKTVAAQLSTPQKPQSPAPAAPVQENVPEDSQGLELQFKLALAALQQGQINEAVGILASVTKSAPNDARFRAFYGRALAANKGTRRRAEGELRAALSLDPDNPDYRTMLAELYRDLGFSKRAQAEAERALAAAPHHRGARDLLRSLENAT